MFNLFKLIKRIFRIKRLDDTEELNKYLKEMHPENKANDLVPVERLDIMTAFYDTVARRQIAALKYIRSQTWVYLATQINRFVMSIWFYVAIVFAGSVPITLVAYKMHNAQIERVQSISTQQLTNLERDHQQKVRDLEEIIDTLERQVQKPNLFYKFGERIIDSVITEENIRDGIKIFIGVQLVNKGIQFVENAGNFIPNFGNVLYEFHKARKFGTTTEVEIPTEVQKQTQTTESAPKFSRMPIIDFIEFSKGEFIPDEMGLETSSYQTASIPLPDPIYSSDIRNEYFSVDINFKTENQQAPKLEKNVFEKLSKMVLGNLKILWQRIDQEIPKKEKDINEKNQPFPELSRLDKLGGEESIIPFEDLLRSRPDDFDESETKNSQDLVEKKKRQEPKIRYGVKTQHGMRTGDMSVIPLYFERRSTEDTMELPNPLTPFPGRVGSESVSGLYDGKSRQSFIRIDESGNPVLDDDGNIQYVNPKVVREALQEFHNNSSNNGK